MIWAGSNQFIKDEKLYSYIQSILTNQSNSDLLLNYGANYLDSNDFHETAAPILKKYKTYLEEYGKQIGKIESRFYIPYSKDIQIIANNILDKMEEGLKFKKPWEFWK
jgi:hypothetical protein